MEFGEVKMQKIGGENSGREVSPLMFFAWGEKRKRVPAYEAGTLGGGEGFLKGLLLGEWVGGTVHL